jgi:hypothetical protein
MASVTGPYVEQVTEKPLIVIADSPKNEEAIVLKIAGSYGNTEFLLTEIVEIRNYIDEFLQTKHL